MRIVPEPLPFLLKANHQQMVLLLLVINKAVDLFNSHQLVTSPALKFQVNTKLHLVASRSFRSMVTTICNILAIQLRLTVLQTRCTVNVITPSFREFYRAWLTFVADNGAPQQKFEH
jgi:hypothetical protein